jgi:tryptophanase
MCIEYRLIQSVEAASDDSTQLHYSAKIDKIRATNSRYDDMFNALSLKKAGNFKLGGLLVAHDEALHEIAIS